MLCDNASGHGVARAAQLKDQKSSTRAEDAPELAESAGQIRDVTQRIAERQEIDRGIGDRERLGGSLDQQNSKLASPLGKHRFAAVDADDFPAAPHPRHSLPGD